MKNEEETFFLVFKNLQQRSNNNTQRERESKKMAELFAEYEDEYVALIQQIVKHIRFMENLSDGTNFFLNFERRREKTNVKRRNVGYGYDKGCTE